MGLVIILALGLYFLIAIGVLLWAISYAKQHGKSAKRWGAGAALVMFLIPFWDWLPTVAAHKYYCETQAGFWVYKTPEQWKQENPGVMEGLVYDKTMSHVQTPYGLATNLNQRFIHLYKYEGPFLFNLWKRKIEIRDSKNGEIIAREVEFSTSQIRRQAGWAGWKFWLSNENCSIESHRDKGSFDKITSQLEGTK
ncbi:MAG: hypothetical protein ABL880_09530 [Methylotenera sp.]